VPAKPLSANELFADPANPAVTHHREQDQYILRGHLTPAEIDTVIAALNATRSTDNQVAPIRGAAKHTWTVFTRHQPHCPVRPCDCERSRTITPWNYLHTESATAEGPEALPVTWICTYTLGNDLMPDYSTPEAAAVYVSHLHWCGWYRDAIPTTGQILTALAQAVCDEPFAGDHDHGAAEARAQAQMIINDRTDLLAIDADLHAWIAGGPGRGGSNDYRCGYGDIQHQIRQVLAGDTDEINDLLALADDQGGRT
jgi:hypothetical protein